MLMPSDGVEQRNAVHAYESSLNVLSGSFGDIQV